MKATVFVVYFQISIQYLEVICVYNIIFHNIYASDLKTRKNNKLIVAVENNDLATIIQLAKINLMLMLIHKILIIYLH
jgi:hypothetical protein